ncbi:mitochondrial protein [Hirsutella rhossiliensis]|uniref:Mitochondrial protein n=1 Tax=Hirsutella rhossiliensis TaxID=111463 RepID=A0A9P8N3A2_9HYPO|nr:mitochondrial protein [Hirsutella rhossiliensis]KAH0965186.1 mitochondrial protein [Hirsutella rhossiliensis]
MIRSRSLSGRLVGPWAFPGAWNCVANHTRRQLSQSPYRNSSPQSAISAEESFGEAAERRRVDKKNKRAKNVADGSNQLDDTNSHSSDAAKAWTDFFKRQDSVEGPNDSQASWKSIISGQAEKLTVPQRSTNPTGDAEIDVAKSTSTKRARSRPHATPKSSLEEGVLAAKSRKRDSSKKQKGVDSKGGSSNKVASSKKKSGATPEQVEGKRLVVKVVRPRCLHLQPVEEDSRKEVPTLSHSLERVLFNQGVYQMQDERSGVFNFDPYLASIMPIKEFDFNALKDYITSSKDVKLRQLCAQHKMKYCGSTSSMTSILSHFHFLLSAWRQIYIGNLSQSLKPDSLNFTLISRAPAAAYARLDDGVYAIDADKQYDTENVLSMLGKSMEKLLTLPKEEFEKYRKTKSHQIPEEERNADESYHYTTLGDFLMRSQLDAQDSRLPGTGMFDLKTRAVVSIRMDVQGYEKGVGYEIRRRFGQWESFEREYYDMIRSAFLKYSLQVRMGRMDGIFVAFHNTQRIFGFQYISLPEMDQAIHGTNDLRVGDQEFKCSIALLNDLMDRATARFPGRTLRLHVETRPTKVPLTYFFVEPVTEEEMERNQAASKPLADKLEQEIRQSLEDSEVERTQDEAVAHSEQQQQLEETDGPTDGAAADDPQSDAAWKELMRKVEETVENESLGIVSVRDAIQGALEQSGLLRGLTELESDKCLDEMVAVLTAHLLEGKESQDLMAEEDEDSARPDDSDSVSAKDEPKPDGASLTDLIIRVTKTVDEERQSLKTFQRVFVDLATQSRKPETAQEDEAGKMGRDTDGVVEEQDSASAERGAAMADTAEEHTDAIKAGERADASKVEEAAAKADIEHDTKKQPDILGMYVTIRSKVNGDFVERPEQPGRQFDWTVQYAITELPVKRAQKIYAEMKKRRRKAFESDPETKEADWHRMFGGSLPDRTKRGVDYRRRRTQQEAGNPIYVAWNRNPLAPETPLTTDSGPSE